MIVRNGVDVLQRTAEAVRVHSTGVSAIDTLLSGGLRDEQLIELAGPSCTGKTQICLSISASLLMKGQVVHWIDMSDGFSASRLSSVLEARMREDEDAAQEDKLKMLKVSCVVNALHLFHYLHDLEDCYPKPAVFIVDGLGPALQALRAGSTHHRQGGALMTKIGKKLKWVARSNGSAVVTTNVVDGASRPLGGFAWAREPHYRLLLSACKAEGYHSACQVKLQAATFSRPDLTDTTGVVLLLDTGTPCGAHQP
eukprot:jgi/Ulvmu1/3165/UM015_0205.1